MDVEGLVAALPHAAAPETRAGSLNSSAVTIATVSSGFEKGDRVRFTFTQQDAGPRIETIRRAGQ